MDGRDNDDSNDNDTRSTGDMEVVVAGLGEHDDSYDDDTRSTGGYGKRRGRPWRTWPIAMVMTQGVLGDMEDVVADRSSTLQPRDVLTSDE